MLALPLPLLIKWLEST